MINSKLNHFIYKKNRMNPKFSRRIKVTSKIKNKFTNKKKFKKMWL